MSAPQTGADLVTDTCPQLVSRRQRGSNVVQSLSPPRNLRPADRRVFMARCSRRFPPLPSRSLKPPPAASELLRKETKSPTHTHTHTGLLLPPHAVQSSRCRHLHTRLLQFVVIGDVTVRIHVSAVHGLWRLEVCGVWLQLGHQLTPLSWPGLAWKRRGARRCRHL